MATGEISASQYCRPTALKEKKMSWDLLFEEDKSSFTLVQIQISFLVSWEILARDAFLKSNRMVRSTRVEFAWLS